MLSQNQLPYQLKLFLANKNILKVGRAPNVDLSYLQQTCNSSIPFAGGVDLAKMAKERHLITNARSCSLSDLVAVVLHKQLPKNISERISQVWEQETLSDSACDYAALDALASKMIYEQLMVIPIPSPLTEQAAPGMNVLVYHTDRTRIIATGVIAPHPPGSCLDGINVSPTRIVVEVHKVLIPGAIMNQHHKKTLDSFGPPPFKLVCLRSHLRQSTTSLTVMNMPPPTETPTATESGTTSSSEVLAISDTTAMDEMVGHLLLDVISNNDVLEPPAARIIDHESQLEGQTMLDNAVSQAKFPEIRSRVLKDVFHVFNMLYIPQGHGLRIEFARALRDAIFIPDKEDKARITAWALQQDPPKTWATLVQQSANWLWKHCKRTVPPPEVLHPLVVDVFRVYGHLKDAKTGLPLFNTAAWGTAKNILEMISKGFISDPPGIALYTQIGIDAKNGHLPVYHCMRGTTSTEGGVHSHLRSRLPTSGVSVQHLLAFLNDFILQDYLLASSTSAKTFGLYLPKSI